MDPLSIATACITLLSGITALSSQLTSFVSIARGARKDVDGFTRELASLALCVTTMRDEQFAFPESLKVQLVGVLQNCNRVITEMRAILDKHKAGSMGRSMQWSFSDRDDVARLRERLEAHKATLEITLELGNLSILSAVKADTTAIINKTTDIKAELWALRLQVSQLRQPEAGLNPMMHRFLTDTLTYTESLVDPFENYRDDHQEQESQGDHYSHTSGSDLEASNCSQSREEALGTDGDRLTDDVTPPVKRQQTTSTPAVKGDMPEPPAAVTMSPETNAISERVFNIIRTRTSLVDFNKDALLQYMLASLRDKSDHTKAMQWMLEQGVHANLWLIFNKSDGVGSTPLAQYFPRFCDNIDAFSTSALYLAILIPQFRPFIEILVEHGARIHGVSWISYYDGSTRFESYWSLLCIAVLTGDLPVIRRVVKLVGPVTIVATVGMISKHNKCIMYDDFVKSTTTTHVYEYLDCAGQPSALSGPINTLIEQHNLKISQPKCTHSVGQCGRGNCDTWRRRVEGQNYKLFHAHHNAVRDALGWSKIEERTNYTTKSADMDVLQGIGVRQSSQVDRRST